MRWPVALVVGIAAACSGDKDTAGPAGPVGCEGIAGVSTIATLTGENAVGIGHDVAVAPDCAAHVVAWRVVELGGDHDVQAAVVQGDAVTVETLELPDDVGDQIDLELGDDGARHLLYSRSLSGPGALVYAVESDGGWLDEQLGQGAGDSGFGGWNALDLAPDGTAHIAWEYGGYAFGTLPEGLFQGTWADDVSLDVDLAVDELGRAVLVGNLNVEEGVKVARREDEGFEDLGYVDPFGGNTGFDVDVETFGQDVHVIYVSGGSDDLRYASNASGAWEAEIVAEEPAAWTKPSLALDSEGRPVIGVRDEGADQMVLLVRDGAAWTRHELGSPTEGCGGDGGWTSVDQYVGQTALDIVDDVAFLTWFSDGALCLTRARLADLD